MTTFTINQKPAVTNVDPTADVFPIWQNGAQKTATATQIVDSVPMVGDSGSGGTAGIVPAPGAGDAAALKVLGADATWRAAPSLLTGNITYTIGPTGDYADVQSAIAAMANSVQAANAVITLEIQDGTIVSTSPILMTGPYGRAIVIKGKNTYTRNITSVQSSSGSAGAWSIVLNVNSVANIAVNDYIALSAASGGVNPTYLCGCHKITNVDAVNTRITITSKHHNATPPSGAVTGSATVLKSALYFTNCDGVQVWGGSTALNLQNIVIAGNDNVASVGLSIQDLGRLFIYDTVGVVGFSINALGLYNSEVNGATIISSGAGSAGFWLRYGAVCDLTTMVTSGSSGYGYRIGEGGVLTALTNGAVSTGNTSDGFFGETGGVLNVHHSISTGNGGYGYNTAQNGYIYNYGYIAVNNASGDSGPLFSVGGYLDVMSTGRARLNTADVTGLLNLGANTSGNGPAIYIDCLSRSQSENIFQSTGAVAGNEVAINAHGYLGLGTTAPATQLSIGASHGQQCGIHTYETLATIAASAYTDVSSTYPAGAIVLAASVRVVADIPGTTTFTVGNYTNAALYSTAAVGSTAGSTDPGTKAGAYYSSGAFSIRITPNATPSDNTGRVRVTVHYIVVTPATS